MKLTILKRGGQELCYANERVHAVEIVVVTRLDAGNPIMHTRAPFDVATSRVFVEGGVAIGVVETIKWDDWKVESSEESVKASVKYTIIGDIVGEQIFNFLLEGYNLVNGTTIGEVAANHNKQEFLLASGENETLARNKMVASKNLELNHALCFGIQFSKDVIDF